MRPSLLCFASVFLVATMAPSAYSFLCISPQLHRRSIATVSSFEWQPLFHSRDPPNDDGKTKKKRNGGHGGGEKFDLVTLQERLVQMRVQMLEQELQQPPNPDLSAKGFVRQILLALYDNANPLPDSGFRVLLRSSTPRWRHELYHSVGAPATAREDAVASALGDAISRPNNQFGLLVENSIDDSVFFGKDMDDKEPHYDIDFPTDVLDYCDGTCWLECHLRDKMTGALLVDMGWQLQRRSIDGAWLVDQIDWQDFRDKFRPGVGREEWMRICG